MRHVECQQLLADALVDVQHCRPPRRSGELGADTGVGVDRIEQTKSDGAQRLLGLGVGSGVCHDASDDVVGGRREEVIPVGSKSFVDITCACAPSLCGVWSAARDCVPRRTNVHERSGSDPLGIRTNR